MDEEKIYCVYKHASQSGKIYSGFKWRYKDEYNAEMQAFNMPINNKMIK